MVLVSLAAEAGRPGVLVGNVGECVLVVLFAGLDYGASMQDSVTFSFGQWVQWADPGR